MLRRRSKKPPFPHGPSRHLVEVSPHRTTGGVHVEELTPYPAEYESPYEKLAIPLLLLCHDVRTIRSQHKRIYVDSKGIEHEYTADFLVELPASTKLLEVKSLRFLLEPEQLAKYLEIAKHFQRTKQPFGFLVDAQLVQQPLRSIANLLFRYVTAQPSEDVVERSAIALQEGPMPIADLCNTTGLTLADAYTLIAKRHLCIDWACSLNKTSQVSLPNNPYRGLLLDDILRSTRHGDLLETLALGRGTPDQHRLADAAAWRQTRQPLAPWNFAGGFSGAEPLRDLGEEECRARKSWERRDRAPGNPTKPANT